MPHTLWRGDELLGQTELEGRPEGGRAGLFRATPAFGAVRPVFERRQALMRRSAEVLAARRPELPPAEAMRQALRETGFGPELVANEAELQALRLVLRDAAGAEVTGNVTVSELEIPSFPDLTAEQRAAVAADFAAAGLTLEGPNWLLVLLPERPGRALPDDAAPA